MIQKVDFQGDDLYIYYCKKGDSDLHIKHRMLVVNWRTNKEILDILKRMFDNVMQRYLADEEKVIIDWDNFMADVKRYEENQK